jgi:hypothetical protein
VEWLARGTLKEVILSKHGRYTGHDMDVSGICHEEKEYTTPESAIPVSSEKKTSPSSTVFRLAVGPAVSYAIGTTGSFPRGKAAGV